MIHAFMFDGCSDCSIMFKKMTYLKRKPLFVKHWVQ